LLVRRVEGWIIGEGLLRKHLVSFGKKDKDIKKKKDWKVPSILPHL